MNYINSIINRKTNEEIIIQKIDKFQRIINSLNDYICLLRTKIQVMAEDLNDIKLLLKYKKIQPIKNKNNYFHFNWKNPFGFWRVETNFHCGEQPNNYNLGSKTHWLGFKSPSKNYNKFGCLWAEDKIEIYYNDRLVRKLTDDKLLDEYRGKTMNVKINTHVDKNIDTTNPTQSEYKIKYFKYEKL